MAVGLSAKQLLCVDVFMRNARLHVGLTYSASTQVACCSSLCPTLVTSYQVFFFLIYHWRARLIKARKFLVKFMVELHLKSF
jgi:hypothetical protein